MEAPAPDGWLTRQEAAARLGIGLRTLDWQRARGEHGSLACFVRVGGRRRLLYSERELDRYIGRRELRDAEARARLHAAIVYHTKQRLARQEMDALIFTREMRQTLLTLAAAAAIGRNSSRKKARA